MTSVSIDRDDLEALLDRVARLDGLAFVVSAGADRDGGVDRAGRVALTEDDLRLVARLREAVRR